jgi:hypothetical protein
MVELGTRRTTERVRDGNSPPKVARVVFLPDGHLPAGTDDNLQRLVGGGTTEADERVLVWRVSSYER